tara:strand:- start:641 stop:862 length:222 start_codon:yes stop_codon:yes gene_type:complete
VKQKQEFREEVKKRIDKLLFEARDSIVKGESMNHVSEKIVSMICDPLGSWYYTEKKEKKEESFSDAKERWIAR